MKIRQIESRDMCSVCGQTPCNCTHLTEMHSDTPRGRIKSDGTRSHSTYGSRDHYNLGDPETTLGPDSVLTKKDVAKKAVQTLDKAFGKSHKKGVAEGTGDGYYYLQGGIERSKKFASEAEAMAHSKRFFQLARVRRVTLKYKEPGQPAVVVKEFTFNDSPPPKSQMSWGDFYLQGKKQGVEEVDRRGFLKGLGAAAVAGATGGANAKGLIATIPVHTDSDPPLPRTVKMAWNYFSPDVLTQDDKNNIVKLINLLYFAKMAPEEWRDSQNGRIIGNATPSQIYKKCYELLIFINDAFINLDFGKVMNDQKSKLENLYKTDPEQFKKLQEFFLGKWETITTMGRLLQKKLTKDSNSEPNDLEQKRRENLQRMQQGAGASGPTNESARDIGQQIKAAYQRIYNAGDDAIEFAYNDSPIFAQYWDEYEGDLDSIIAEVEPSELQIILDELTSAVEDQGLTEVSRQRLGDYLHAAQRDVVDRATSASFQSGQAGDRYNRADTSPREKTRQAGISRAISRLTK